jgi:hypothetical protein
MSTEDVIKIIETSTVKRIDYEIKQIGETLWKLSGNIPHTAISYLHENQYMCYLSKDEFFISGSCVKEES